ncbi:uncharacterized protein LOC113491675 isoform X2 [Trichoplusia ni]|uniref:Uncharacterized protein LOC113491675 isoform X2 n=1 Tax=Trichoplusia ni TaxID=7111 RepID=A0A7E5V8H4_TRINI|nr:uncharacterized protein LOC113491675 isoform X2 [Trichoplusia ni]
MIKNIVIFYVVVVCLFAEIHAKDCPFYSIKLVNVTKSYTTSYLVTYYGDCHFGSHCLLSRWETRVMNRTIEKPSLVRNPKCCERPGGKDDQARDRECMPHGIGAILLTDTTTKLGDPWLETTSTEEPQNTKNDSVDYDIGSVMTTEVNNGTAPSYRSNTSSAEINNNGAISSTTRLYNYSKAVYPRYKTFTERSYNSSLPDYPTYRLTTRKHYNGSIADYFRRTYGRPSVLRSEHYPRSRTTTEGTDMNKTVPNDVYERNDTKIKEDFSNLTHSFESLPDLNPPYNWNHGLHRRTHVYGKVSLTTSSTDTTTRRISTETMTLKERRIWIVITIILAFTALCLTLLVIRCILFKKHENKSRLNKEEDTQAANNIPPVVYATYAGTEAQVANKSIYPKISDL